MSGALWPPRATSLGALALVLMSACQRQPPANPPVSADDESPRKPDGVAIDPVSKPPEAADEAQVGDGWVTLRTPLGTHVATDAADKLMRRVVREDIDGVTALFTPDAIAVTSFSPQARQTPNATLWWDRRFRELDYSMLVGEQVVRSAELTIYRGQDVIDGRLPIAVDTGSMDEVQPSDIVVVLPIATPRVGANRLLGDEVILYMRRQGDRFQIYRMVEEFQLQ